MKTLKYTTISQPEFKVIPGNPVFSKEGFKRANKLAQEQKIESGKKLKIKCECKKK